MIKNSIIKYSHAVIALLMITTNVVEVFASTTLTANPSDDQHAMSLYPNITLTDTHDAFRIVHEKGVFINKTNVNEYAE